MESSTAQQKGSKAGSSETVRRHKASALLAQVERLKGRCMGRMAVHLRISKLAEKGFNQHQARIVAQVFETSLSALEGDFYHLYNQDLVFIGLSRQIKALEAAEGKLASLLEEHDVSLDTLRREHILLRFGLDLKYDVFLSHVRNLAVQEQRAYAGEKDANDTAFDDRRPLNSKGLAELERLLENADITDLVRQQSACRLTDDLKTQRIFTEYFTSIREVERNLLPGTDLLENRALFKYLTQVLDLRMLVVLRHEASRSSEEMVSININVATLLSQKFLKFDQEMPIGLRGRLMLEVQYDDVFSDLKNFAFARDFVRQQGYRLCLDGIGMDGFSRIDRNHLKVDYVKLVWDDSWPQRFNNSIARELQSLVDRNGPEHTILHRCQDEKIIRFGQKFGIQLFQGHYVDGLPRASLR